MGSLLEIVVNEPFQAELIQDLYSNKEDLLQAFPKAKHPFCIKEWTGILQRHPENTSLIFKRNDEVVGHTALIINAENLYLCFVIVQSNFRRQGLAKLMISQSEEFTRLNYSHTDMYLNVSSKNTSAIELYKAMSYQVVSQLSEKITMKKNMKN